MLLAVRGVCGGVGAVDAVGAGWDEGCTVRCDGCFLSASAAEPVPHDHDQPSECGLTVAHLLVEPDVEEERVHHLEQPAAPQVGSGCKEWRG